MAITKGMIIERPEEGSRMGAGLVERFTAIGRRPSAVIERLKARMPRLAEIQQLQLRPGILVLIISRTTYAEDKTPLETADLDAHRFELEYTLKVDSAQ